MQNFLNPFHSLRSTRYDIYGKLILPIANRGGSIRLSSWNGTPARKAIKFNEAIICLVKSLQVLLKFPSSVAFINELANKPLLSRKGLSLWILTKIAAEYSLILHYIPNNIINTFKGSEIDWFGSTKKFF